LEDWHGFNKGTDWSVIVIMSVMQARAGCGTAPL